MKYAFAITSLAAAVGFATLPAHAANFIEGKDYRVLDNPENISGDTIIVREFFWYGCPHCYNLEPHMQKWAKTKASDVAFFQTPAAMNPTWEVNARGFYAAQQMGIQERTHAPLFKAIQRENQKLFTQNALGKWYAAQGADLKKFNSLYNSFAVSTKVGRSQEAAKRYKLTGVPAVVVQGKYVVSGEDGKVPQVVDFLVDKVRKESK